MRASALTLVRGRADRLDNLLDGLVRQRVPPAEIVVAHMEPAVPAALPDRVGAGIAVRHIAVPGDDMPLAAARNAAAEHAGSELLVFLDVDCIPGAGLIGRYLEAAHARPGVLLGEVHYLPEGAAPRGVTETALSAAGVPHPSKPVLGPLELRDEPDHGELWGLSFALPARTWRRLGGMDPGYVGYGGEETDFAASLRAAGERMTWVGGALAWHQHHPVHVPPLHVFDHIVRNATRYRRKWGRWCMPYWLGQFQAAGLIAWGEDRIEVLRRPGMDEIERARQPGAVRFS